MTGKFCKFNKNELKTNFLNNFFSEKFGEFPSSKTGGEWRDDPVSFGLIPTRRNMRIKNFQLFLCSFFFLKKNTSLSVADAVNCGQIKKLEKISKTSARFC